MNKFNELVESVLEGTETMGPSAKDILKQKYYTTADNSGYDVEVISYNKKTDDLTYKDKDGKEVDIDRYKFSYRYKARKK